MRAALSVNHLRPAETVQFLSEGFTVNDLEIALAMRRAYDQNFETRHSRAGKISAQHSPSTSPYDSSLFRAEQAVVWRG
jgi:hypothetical protein